MTSSCVSTATRVPTNSRERPTGPPFVGMDSNRLGSVTTIRANGFAGAKLAGIMELRSLSIEPTRMLSVPTEGSYVGHSREFVGARSRRYFRAKTCTYLVILFVLDIKKIEILHI